MTSPQRFNPPPNWPEPPQEGWTPPADFRPGDSWGPVPAGWRLWPARERTTGQAPLQDSEEVPASGARPRPRVEQYPVDVLNPGMWSENHLQDEDYGFPPAKPRRDRPRLRLGMTITVTALGLLLAAATVLIFISLVDRAVEDLPGLLGIAAGDLSAHSVPHAPETVPFTPEMSAAVPA